MESEFKIIKYITVSDKTMKVWKTLIEESIQRFVEESDMDLFVKATNAIEDDMLKLFSKFNEIAYKNGIKLQTYSIIRQLEHFQSIISQLKYESKCYYDQIGFLEPSDKVEQFEIMINTFNFRRCLFEINPLIESLFITFNN